MKKRMLELDGKTYQVMLLVCLCILLSLKIHAQTPEDYLQEAAQNNPALKAQYNEYLAALEKVPQVGTLPDPEVAFGYFISPVETRVGAQQARFSVMQMFPWLGTLKVRRDMATEQAKAKYELFEAKKNELFFNVRKLWWQLYEQDRAIQIHKENVQLLESYESLALQRMETGTGSLVDVLRVQMEIDDLKNKVELLKDKRATLRVAFNRQINRSAEQEVTVPDSVKLSETALLKGSLMDSILAGNNRLQSIELEQNAAAYAKQQAIKEGLPSFGLELSYILVSERTDMVAPDNGKDAIMPMVSLKIPLYRAKYKAKRKEAELKYEALEYLEEDFRNQLREQMEIAYADYLDAERRLQLFREQKQKVDQAISILVDAYATQGKDFEEILRLQRMLLMYNLELAKAAKDKGIAIAEIKKLSGETLKI